MTEERKCNKCGKKLRRNNQTPTCWGCRKNKKTGPTKSDDAVLERIGLDQVAAADDLKLGELPMTKKFYSLATELEMNPDHIIEGFARQWVESTIARARGANEAVR